MNIIDYKPAPTVREFIKDYLPGKLFYDWIVGPVGSGKTTGIFFKLAYMARLQAPWKDGIRRSKAVIVRNTMPQLKDTTLASWFQWFHDGQAGKWHETDKRFVLRFGDVECDVLFRPLDTPDDVARVLSLEVTFALIDEFVQIPRQIIDALSARIGRYPPANEGGATNYGMWGSSNPDTEDNWWFEYLHNPTIALPINIYADEDVADMRRRIDPQMQMNVKYFHQPSGLSPQAENLEFLPGKRGYYDNQIKGKSLAWVKQFVESEWGFSVAGKPVIGSFRPDYHIAKQPLRYNPNLPLVAGLDPGLAGSALVFGQEDLSGRLLVLGELYQRGLGAERIVSERVRPYMRKRFPDAKLIIAPDPASLYRSQADEKPIITVFRKYFDVRAETNNRLPLRVDSIDYYANRLTDGGPGLVIDAVNCPMLIRALKGGWRFAIDPKKDQIKGKDPEKNDYSHIGDAMGYLARYFYRQTERELRYGSGRLNPPRTFTPNYHVR